jgi:nucleotide-binding universal stress UspA family protein
MVEYKNILFCTDFSEDAEIAFWHALDIARKHNSELHILHVVHSSYRYARHIVDEYLPKEEAGPEAFFSDDVEKLAAEALKNAYTGKLGGYPNVRFVILGGAPDVTIVKYAKKNEIDMIIMGALGRSEQDRLVHGSTVANVSKYAHCHVMAVRNPAKQFTLPGSMY